MPDQHDFGRALAPYQRRLRTAACANATLMAAGIAALLLIALTLGGVSRSASLSASAATLLLSAVWAGASWSRGWTPARVASAVDRQTTPSDNIVVTMQEVAAGAGRRPHRHVVAALQDAAAERLRRTPADRVQPLTRAVSLAIGAILAVGVLAAALPEPGVASAMPPGDGPMSPAILSPGDLRVVVTPPGYAHRRTSAAINPTSITVLEGSRVRLETAQTQARVTLLESSNARTPFAPDNGSLSVELVAARSQPLVVRSEDANAAADRLLHLRVEPDARPTVRIARPGADLLFPLAAGTVPIEIEARDDVGLVSIELRYTVVSGSGEAFSFKEGTWPVEIARAADGEWNARGLLSLAGLNLQEGDALVYRAVARDGKPGADPAISETFLIEIGRLAGAASTGFALPDERDRQGLSQQMLIIKTERLQKERATLSPDALIEQSRLLAVEQRMVRAEFVFMTGGEVADEVEEATHAHELAEGRHENSAQIDLLAAIREMSRAEARLNDGDTAQALQFERAALTALQRAFDRRRYLLRTLPERTRIDLARRLTGDRGSARSSNRVQEPSAVDPVVVRARLLLHDLAAARSDHSDPAVLASRVIALDPSSDALQQAAVVFVGANTGPARDAALREAERRVIEVLRQRLPLSEPARLRADPIAGNVAQELQRRRESPR